MIFCLQHSQCQVFLCCSCFFDFIVLLHDYDDELCGYIWIPGRSHYHLFVSETIIIVARDIFIFISSLIYIFKVASNDTYKAIKIEANRRNLFEFNSLN